MTERKYNLLMNYIKDVKKDHLFWYLIFPLGVFLRLYRLGHFSLWYDEGASIQLSKLVDKKLSFLSPSLNNEPPMNPFLTFLWLKFLDKIRFWEKYTEWDDFSIRLLPCFWSIVSIVVFYYVAKRIFTSSRFGVLLSTFLFSIVPFQIYYAQELRIYSFYVFVNLIGMLLVLRILEKNQWSDWTGLGVVFVILMYSHFFSAWVILTTNIFFFIIIVLYRRELFRKWFWTNFVAGVLVLPVICLGSFFYFEVLSNVKYSWYPMPTIKTGFITWKNLFAGYTDRSWAYWGIFIITTSCFFLGILRFNTNLDNKLYIVLQSFFPILSNIILWNFKEFCFYEHRLFIFSGVVGVVGVALGISSINNKLVRYGITFVLIFLTLICLNDYYKGRIHPLEIHRLGLFEKVDFRNASKFIRINFDKNDCVLAYHSFSRPSMAHYLGDFRQFVIALDYSNIQVFIGYLGNPTLLEHHGLLPIHIKDAIRKERILLFLESTGISFESKVFTEYVKKWLGERCEKLGEKEFEGLYLTIWNIEKLKEDLQKTASNGT